MDLCRIFAVKKIIREFRGIREHENDLWETVRDANLQGINFKNIARIFVLSDDLKMTRDPVAKTDTYVYKPWNIQKSVYLDPEYAGSNISIIENFKTSHVADLKTVMFGSEASSPYVMLENLSYDEVRIMILEKFLFPERSALQREMTTKLAVLMHRKNIDPRIDVIWMRDGSYSKHDLSDGDITNYMVGRRPDDPKKPVIYAGDRYQFVKTDTMQLQIHMIKDRLTDKVSPALALYIPDKYIEKLANLVIRR